MRDDLAERLRGARAAIAERAELEERNRVLLERMLLEPGRHKFVRRGRRRRRRARLRHLHVRPRLGIVGMLMGWWQVKLSSGCPLARGPRAQRPRSASRP